MYNIITGFRLSAIIYPSIKQNKTFQSDNFITKGEKVRSERNSSASQVLNSKKGKKGRKKYPLLRDGSGLCVRRVDIDDLTKRVSTTICFRSNIFNGHKH